MPRVISATCQITEARQLQEKFKKVRYDIRNELYSAPGIDMDTLVIYNGFLTESIQDTNFYFVIHRVCRTIVHCGSLWKNFDDSESFSDLSKIFCSVRGNLDPRILTPEVNERSSILSILLRLGNQINDAFTLADVTYLGPEANPNELQALARIDEILERIYETITPESTPEGSDTS